MEHAVDIRVAGRPEAAHRAAEAIARSLAQRPRAGASLHVHEQADDAPLHLEIAMRADEMIPALLPPVPLPDEPEAAATEAMHFLEAWGFIGHGPATR